MVGRAETRPKTADSVPTAVRRAKATPTVSTATRAQYRPIARVWATALPGSKDAWPRKGARATAMPRTANRHPAVKETAAATTALASCRRCLAGTHWSEVRTLSVAYSLVTMVIASTTMANWPRMAEETGALPSGWTGLSLIRAIEP